MVISYLSDKEKGISNSKAQSALEYMLTYGWAIMAIVVIIAILYALGLFTPANNLPSTIISGFTATPVTAVVANSSAIELEISNAKTSAINVSGISVSVNNQNFTTYTCSDNGELQPGSRALCIVRGTYSSKVSAQVFINYSFYNGAFVERDVSKGTITTPVITNIMASLGSTYFIESGLPTRYTWRVTYNNTVNSSSTNEISFKPVNYPGYFQFTVSILSNSTNGCTTTYTPSPASGTAASGTDTGVSFSNNTVCTTTFTESGLPGGYQWTVVYNGAPGSSTTTTIQFSDSPGTYSYTVNTLSNSSSGCTTTYTP